MRDLYISFFVVNTRLVIADIYVDVDHGTTAHGGGVTLRGIWPSCFVQRTIAAKSFAAPFRCVASR